MLQAYTCNHTHMQLFICSHVQRVKKSIFRTIWENPTHINSCSLGAACGRCGNTSVWEQAKKWRITDIQTHIQCVSVRERKIYDCVLSMEEENSIRGWISYRGGDGAAAGVSWPLTDAAVCRSPRATNYLTLTCLHLVNCCCKIRATHANFISTKVTLIYIYNFSYSHGTHLII